METLTNLGAFLLAVVAVIINGVPQLLYAQARGFAIKPAGISTPQVIMSVATLDNMEIEALVDESDIGQVKEGQKVKFTVDAYPEETFMGTVRLLSKKATTENNVIYYKVYVTVDDAKGKLLPIKVSSG